MKITQNLFVFDDDSAQVDEKKQKRANEVQRSYTAAKTTSEASVREFTSSEYLITTS